MNIEELKERLTIEKGNLDTEISQHPMLFFEVSEACVQAKAECDACKEELTSIDATLDGDVRIALAKKEKVTEAMVKNAVQVHQKHVDAFDTYMQAKTKADLLSALKEAFSSRGYMLRDLVSLVSVGFYESTSMGQHNIDKARYNKQREKLAEARTGRGG
jgi:hypothetical protein